MSDMVRKQIYISRRQQAMLKRLSELRSLSESEIIRQAIDREAANAAVPGSQPASRQAWNEAYQFMLSLRERADRFSEPYRWNREELYEERLNRPAPHAVSDAESDVDS